MRRDYHIVHFTGHGTFNDENNKGYLILETEDGKAREMDNGAISDLLAGRKYQACGTERLPVWKDLE